MESGEFDAALGGTEKLPYSANSLKFAASRSVEIAAMTESILHPNKTKLIFQTLPVHMRRRVMSHNCKRLPQKLRQAHLEQLKKSGLPPKQKRPSRKFRRRPANLLTDYNRRGRQNVWLETHIWHAKRFHMRNRWGYRIANAPCDKAFRACYRASSAHCLLQDISYNVPIQIIGPFDDIKDFFSNITDPATGLSVVAKAYTTGMRQGEIHLYQDKMFPYGYIGKAQFLWENTDSVIKKLWLFTHASYFTELDSVFTGLTSSVGKESENNAKKQKLANKYENLKIIKPVDSFNIFRLTGPNSHAVLTKSLKCIEDFAKIKDNAWVQECKGLEGNLKVKKDYWESLSAISCPSQLPPHLLLGLVVKDPRLTRPPRRTKAIQNTAATIDRNLLMKIPSYASSSPIWTTELQSVIKSKVKPNGMFIQHVTKQNLVPGEVYEDDPEIQSVPVMLKQRPGSQDPVFKKIGYGSGWDIIVPPGYGMPFWLTFIMYGARSGGLRETESLAFEMGECYLPPDSMAGSDNEQLIESQLSMMYFKRPASKRVNYTKLAVNSPFKSPWQVLLKDWGTNSVVNYYVLRNRRLLESFQECIKKKKCLFPIQDPDLCLVAVYLQLPKGSLKRNALICLPTTQDITSRNSLSEPLHPDPNRKLRKQTKAVHLKQAIKIKRMRLRWRRKGFNPKDYRELILKEGKADSRSPSKYVLRMRELWLPPHVKTVRHLGARQTMGYVSQAGFSFTQATSCGIGYIAYNALQALLMSGINQVFVRNTSSRQYRLANITIVKSV